MRENCQICVPVQIRIDTCVVLETAVKEQSIHRLLLKCLFKSTSIKQKPILMKSTNVCIYFLQVYLISLQQQMLALSLPQTAAQLDKSKYKHDVKPTYAIYYLLEVSNYYCQFQILLKMSLFSELLDISVLGFTTDQLLKHNRMSQHCRFTSHNKVTATAYKQNEQITFQFIADHCNNTHRDAVSCFTIINRSQSAAKKHISLQIHLLTS